MGYVPFCRLRTPTVDLLISLGGVGGKKRKQDTVSCREDGQGLGWEKLDRCRGCDLHPFLWGPLKYPESRLFSIYDNRLHTFPSQSSFLPPLSPPVPGHAEGTAMKDKEGPELFRDV